MAKLFADSELRMRISAQLLAGFVMHAFDRTYDSFPIYLTMRAPVTSFL